MDLNSIFKDFCKTLKNVEDTSKIFADLKTDEQRFEMAYILSHDYLHNLNLPEVGKCGVKSTQAREYGNERFRDKNYWESLMFYSKSLALAPKGSMEFALALGNRSACLLKLDFPEKALKDIEEAMALSEDVAHRNKLFSRKEKCEERCLAKHCNGLKLETSLVPLLSRGKSDFFDSASSALKLSSNDTLGRHLIASEDVKTGEVLIVEKPFSSVLLPDHYYTHCANCFCRCIQLIPCSHCPTSMYCSEKCLKTSLNKNHRIECAVLDVLTKLKAWRMELLALRILIEASNQGEKLENFFQEVSEYSSDSVNINISVNNSYSEDSSENTFYSYNSTKHITSYNLVANTDKRSVADLFYRALIVSVLVVFLEKCTNFFNFSEEKDLRKLKNFSGGLMLRYMQSLPCNAHEVSEFRRDGSVEIGAGLYNTLSLINHSCDPNVVRHCYGDVVVLRSIRPIAKGEEVRPLYLCRKCFLIFLPTETIYLFQIVDNYGYHYATHTFGERQAALCKQYYFSCRCQACQELWPLYDDLPDERPIFNQSTNPEDYKKLTQLFEVKRHHRKRSIVLKDRHNNF